MRTDVNLILIAALLVLSTNVFGVTKRLIADGLDFPTAVAFGPGDDSRIYVTQQWQGKVQLIHNGVRQPEPFLDIQHLLIGAAVEGGLLGIAFDPDFEVNRRFYICYASQDSNVVVARYIVSPDSNFADPTSAEIIFDIEHGGRQHFAGNIAFGQHDKYLYISVGDGGIPPSWDSSQNGMSYKGKILRIDVSGESGYMIPEDNPFVDDENVLNEIYALGLRNPWRFSLDSETGDMFIGDVGQGLYEEINYISFESGGGQNFGWHVWEGSHCHFGPCTTNGLTFPIYQYPNNPLTGAAVTGGYVYRGCAIPEWVGRYVFADYASATIGSFRYINGIVTDFIDYTPVLNASDDDSLWYISSFGQDNHGELYMLDYVHMSWASKLYKIVPDDDEDCNNNFVNDRCDIEEGTSDDENNDGIPDECQTAADDRPGLPGEFALLPNYPNPFNPATTISFVLPNDAELTLRVFDLTGRLVTELANGRYAQGTHSVSFDGDGLASGVYFTVLQSGDVLLRQKMMLLK